ncbi:hypothetical protein [Bradyrhizobium sp. LTSP849]|uniref:hypothetical protein n=1 Tax=Bradyrhizobium sp. LTSP849 TaxID=1615890 RepID=UPI0005D23590|nr:hypothetical protein [Bradyrhizobium sp. LTSP849]
MGNDSTKMNSLKVMQGREAEAVKTTETLTHKDIKRFFLKLAEAILVDQQRVNKISREYFHPSYDDGRWRETREEYLDAIIDLSLTVDKMPKRLLKNLTELAITYAPDVVKRPLFDIITLQAIGVVSPGIFDTASRVFRELIVDVSLQAPSIPFEGTPVESILRWFDYDDPILIATEPECEYAEVLASHIGRESRKTRCALAAQGRQAFMEARGAREFTTVTVLSAVKIDG